MYALVLLERRIVLRIENISFPLETMGKKKIYVQRSN